jgi:hypothetical protein
MTTTTEHALPQPLIKIYPNPTTGLVSIEIGENPSTLSIDVYDVFGRLWVSKKVEPQDRTVDVGDFEEGVYIITIRAGRSKIWTEKLIKIK